MVHGRYDRKNADAIGDEIGCVFSNDYTFTNHRGQHSFQITDNFVVGVVGWNDLNQVHIPWGVEEMNTAEFGL